MIHRCIMIFPKFQNLQLIEEVRSQYDPLFKKVQPHITLVFPFKSDLSKENLREHIENKLKGLEPFRLKLHGVSGAEGGFLFLNVMEGREELVQIHQRLYEGILNQFYPPFLSNREYKPHMTIGRIRNPEEFHKIVENCKTLNHISEEIVSEISVEIIDERENSIIEMTIRIKDSAS